jgi:DNA sulfur modification protein DndD
MSVKIKKIELKNWFGYFGEYEENSFEFSDGVNIIVATNDIGKSKLHNAFRWLLTDSVILKNKLNKYEFTKIDLNTIEDILNHQIQLKLNHDQITSLGVRISFEQTNRGDIIKRIVTKEIQCKKDVDKIIVLNTITKSQREERGNIKTAPEAFEDLIEKIIRPKLLGFFLVQGEALEDLTPLKGESLRNTINDLVNLNVLEKKCDLSVKISKKVTQLRQGIEGIENRNNLEAQLNTQEKSRLENEISQIEESDLKEIRSFIDECDITINTYSEQANSIRARQGLKNTVDDYNQKINIKAGEIKNHYGNFVSNYINRDFWLSKITNIKDEINRLEVSNLEINDYAAIRRTELNDKLTTDEQRWLYALERDQPRPAILNQMLEENKCYVCSSSLTDSASKYMREKLIPYFKKELNHNDEELNKYHEISEIYKKINGFLNKYDSYENNYFQTQIDKVITEESLKLKLQQDLDDFISQHGLIEVPNSDLVNLSTYNTAVKDKEKYQNKYNDKRTELLHKRERLRNINNTLPLEDKSEKLSKAEKLEQFGKLISNELINIKKNAYEIFSNELETIINFKWKEFSKENKGLSEQFIKVDFALNNLNQPDFEIKVVDKFGNNLSQGGGASQALRQLSVIFGLIEKAGGNVNYPFIADAPTTNMTSTLSEQFFNFQLENASTQNILITKELWDDKKGDLNEHGKHILNKVAATKNAKLFTITNGKENKKVITEEKL